MMVDKCAEARSDDFRVMAAAGRGRLRTPNSAVRGGVPALISPNTRVLNSPKSPFIKVIRVMGPGDPLWPPWRWPGSMTRDHSALVGTNGMRANSVNSRTSTPARSDATSGNCQVQHDVQDPNDDSMEER